MIQFVTLDPVFLTPPDTVIETKVYSLGLVSRLAHYVPYNRGVGICFKLSYSTSLLLLYNNYYLSVNGY